MKQIIVYTGENYHSRKGGDPKSSGDHKEKNCPASELISKLRVERRRTGGAEVEGSGWGSRCCRTRGFRQTVTCLCLSSSPAVAWGRNARGGGSL